MIAKHDDIELNEAVGMDIIDAKSLDLWILGASAVSFSVKIKEMDANGLKGIPEFTGYFKHASDFVDNVATNNNTAEPSDAVFMIAGKLKKKLKIAQDSVIDDVSRRRTADYHKEVWDFYREVVEQIVDSVKVMTNKHKRAKGSSGCDHNTRVQFKHGNNTWVYNVRTKGRNDSEIKSFFNGVLEPEQSKTGEAVGYLLARVAWVIAMEKGLEFIAEMLATNPDNKKTSLKLATVLGGDYKRYMPISSILNGRLKGYEHDVMSVDKAAVLEECLAGQLKCSQADMDWLLNPFTSPFGKGNIDISSKKVDESRLQTKKNEVLEMIERVGVFNNKPIFESGL